VMTARPHVMTARPNVMTVRQHVMTARPHVVTARPNVMTARQHVITARQHVVTARQHVMTARQHVMTARPPMVIEPPPQVLLRYEETLRNFPLRRSRGLKASGRLHDQFNRALFVAGSSWSALGPHEGLTLGHHGPQMSVPLSILEARLQQARQQYPKVVEQMRRRGALVQQTLRKDPGARRLHSYRYWCGPGQWWCLVAATDTGIEAHALYYWFHSVMDHRHEALEAILLRGAQRPLHFDTHFFGRWGKRSELMGVKLTNMIGFFRQYPQPPVRHVPRFYPAQPELGAAITQGLILARHHGTKLICCDTFKDHSMLSPEERILWERLNALNA